ncbi:MAG: hypothetical protein R6V84_04120 [Desulfobacterales bacterium]
MRPIALGMVLGFFFVCTAWAGPAPGIIPEMRECMQSHGSQAQYAAVLQKYCDPGIMRQAMGLLVIKKPYVIKTEQKGPVVCYTVEGTTEGTSSEMPADTTQTYNVCWENGRIVSLEFYGAKPRVHQEIIPQMRECMRAHGSPAEYEAALKKYCDPGIIRQAMGLLVIKDPYVVQTETKGPVVTYTVEGRTVGTSSEIPSDVVQVYRVSWRNAKVVSLEFLGPKHVAAKP